MLNAEQIASLKDYSDKFDTWAKTINRAIKNGREDFDEILSGAEIDYLDCIDKLVSAWDVTINFVRTEVKAGRMQAHRMGLARGVDHRRFHPAQLKKGVRNARTLIVDAEAEVNKALEGK